MAKYNNILELIGNTPIVRFNEIVENPSINVWGKLETFNPMSSVKDRIGLSMILDAEERGLLKPGDTILEPTSGNTGIALAYISAQRGYKLILTMPETVSQERVAILKAFGAEIILIKPEAGPGMTGSIAKAIELQKKFGYFMPMQFKNLANPEIHRKTTGPEIIDEFKETGLDYFVAGIGTGGTITGAGKILREYFPKIQIIAVEPKKSPLLSGGSPGKHIIQGIGAGFIPEILDTTIYDKIIQVTDEDAKFMTQKIAKEEGILAGISTGAAVWSAIQVSKRMKENENLLVICPDTGERYLSTALFE
ncbi:MAG: cysteine synthase A [Candidatus Marinimicrobia bacterium]|nr:cysteine synthase A [Candidatus Neomarinimicrobiota bacterium]MBL7023101.1 cysteine synthase A [Candidatus Neomarinimicrobiota bacterium]MBL7109121.1 cysteine synthase A [Candidatus Neomarinimicrobiota bacterium]